MKKAIQDVQTVTPDGKSILPVPHGVIFKEVPTHVDDRGMVCEMFDPRWNISPDPIVFSYFFTVRPGLIKGWGMHKIHEDRYFIISGEMETALYDDRPDSPTYKMVSKIYLSEFNRGVMIIPRGVWHADRNVGLKDCLVVNFPTIQYNHSSPDKYRLPLDTDLIPYKFENPRGW